MKIFGLIIIAGITLAALGLYLKPDEKQAIKNQIGHAVQAQTSQNTSAETTASSGTKTTSEEDERVSDKSAEGTEEEPSEYAKAINTETGFEEPKQDRVAETYGNVIKIIEQELQ